jgi:hypothetical protein
MNKFNILLYIFILPYLFKNSIDQKNILLLLCFLSILLGHLYKDNQDKKWQWPRWVCPYLGIVIGFILLVISDDIIVKTIGLIKIIAHLKKDILNYTNNYYF